MTVMRFTEGVTVYVLLRGMDAIDWRGRYPGHTLVPTWEAQQLVAQYFPRGRGLDRVLPRTAVPKPPQRQLDSVAMALGRWDGVLLRQTASEVGAAPGPVARERPKPAEPVKAVAEPDRLVLQVETMTGEALSSELPFWLENPDGSLERKKVSGGEFKRDDPASGMHRAHFQKLHLARWSRSAARWGETVELYASAPRFPEGTLLTFNVYDDDDHEDADPIASLDAVVRKERLEAEWLLKLVPETRLRVRFVFHLAHEKFSVHSPVLAVSPHPISEARGLRERLMHLGYQPGEVEPEPTEQLSKALKMFQEDSALLEATGLADPGTLALLGTLT